MAERKPSKFKNSSAKRGKKQEDEEDPEGGIPEDGTIAKKIENSQNIQKLVSRFVRAEGNFKFLKKKKRKVARDIYKRAYDIDKILKVGRLSKQGGRVKTWKNRYFVLRQKLMFYFESLEAFEEGAPPKGWIWIRDMMPNKKNFVCTGTIAFMWRFKVHAFTVQTEKRTYAICAKTKEEKLEWMKAIQNAYRDFWRSYGLPVPVYKSPAGADDDHGTLAHLKPIAQKLDTYDELEQAELEEKTRLLMLSQCFVRWKTYVKLEKIRRNKK